MNSCNVEFTLTKEWCFEIPLSLNWEKKWTFQWLIAVIRIWSDISFGCMTAWGRAWKAEFYTEWRIRAGNPEIGSVLAWLHCRMKIFIKVSGSSFIRWFLIFRALVESCVFALVNILLSCCRRESGLDNWSCSLIGIAHLPFVVLHLSL